MPIPTDLEPPKFVIPITLIFATSDWFIENEIINLYLNNYLLGSIQL